MEASTVIAWLAFGFVQLMLVALAYIGVLQIRSRLVYNRPFVLSESAQKLPFVQPGMRAGVLEGDFVVFLIGACVHKPWDVRTIYKVGISFRRIISELKANPECGFLGGHTYAGNPVLSVQYWRSYEQLAEYARNPSRAHFPVWVETKKTMRSNTSFGIYHETYKVRAGEYECIYGNMPQFGLAAVAGSMPLTGRMKTSQGRMGLTDGSDHPRAADEEVAEARLQQ